MNGTSSKMPRIPRTVLVGHYNATYWLYKPLFTRMREKWGTRFVVLTPENSRLDLEYRPFCGDDAVFEPVPHFQAMISRSASNGHADDADAIAIETARRNEADYGIRYMLDIYQQERDLARGLVSGTSQTPFGKANTPSNATLARAVNAYFKIYESIFDRHDIDLALVWPRTGNEAVCATVAEKRKIMVTYPYTAKYKNFAYWSDGRLCGNDQYLGAYEDAGECEALPRSEVVSPSRPAYLEQNQIDWRYSRANALKQTAWNLLDRVLLMRNDWREGQLGRVNRLSLRTVIGRIWADSAYFRRFIALCEPKLEKLTQSPFVFFAFQNEPEFSVQMRCKEFNDQGAMIRQLALSLPVGVNLVIKEHTFLGGHSIDFYRNLVALPNVIMAHPGLRATELISKAIATASLAGTVTLEAAFQGKPALIFTERSEFALLPSVRVVSGMEELPKIIDELMKPDTQDGERFRRAAARLAKATEMIGFEARHYFTKDGSALEPYLVERALELLLGKFENHQRGLARAAKPADRLSPVMPTVHG
jgi:hypothetical protein